MIARVSTLPNGLRIVSESMPSLKTTSIGVWVSVGSRYEATQINGVSHLLEHMAFKGTTNRSAKDIAEEIEAVGGYVNAYTSREFTAYYARVLQEDIGLAIDILADILQSSIFSDSELKREKGVVIQEIAQMQDTPDEIVFDRFQETAYPNQALGRSILGPASQVQQYSREVLAKYMSQHYEPHRMVVAGAGNLDHDHLVDLVGQAFDRLITHTSTNELTALYQGGEMRQTKELEQAHIVIGFNGFSYTDTDVYTLQMLSLLLGGGMSSRLFQEIRERRGLAYTVYTFNSSYTDGGLFGVYCATGSEKLLELTPVIGEQLMAVSQNVTTQEMDRARAQVKAGLLMSLESSSSRCDRLGRHMLIFGRPISIDEILQKINAVTETDVKRIAAKVFSSELTLAALGPISSLESYDKLLSRFQ